MGRKIAFALWVLTVSVISIIVGLVSALAVIPPITPNLFLHAILNLLIVFGAAFILLIHPARRVSETPVRFTALLALIPVLMLVIYVAVSNLVALTLQPVPVEDELIEALETHTIPLPSVDSTELDALRPALEGRKVIALGEATHGTSEFFRMKHSVIAYVVTELGFRNYGMEISPEDGIFLNRYIHGEDVDPQAVLYWPWATEEVIAMLDWMREYNANASPDDQLTLHGIDPRLGDRDRIMAENVTRIVESHGPIVLWAHNAHIWAAEGGMGSYLKRTFGEDAYLLGFEFSRGQFTSRTSVIHTFEVQDAPPTYYAYALASLDAPILFLDMASMQQNPLLDQWLNTPQRLHNLAEAHHIARFLPGMHTEYKSLPELYDGLIFVEESTPSQVLARVR